MTSIESGPVRRGGSPDDRVLHQRVRKTFIKRRIRDKQPVVAGSPQLIDKKLEIDIVAELPALESLREVIDGERAARHCVVLGNRRRKIGIGLRPADQFSDDSATAALGQEVDEGAELRPDVVGEVARVRKLEL